MKRPNRWIFILLFILSLFLYFYRCQKMFTFDADQEFYAKQSLSIIKEHKYTLLGIETSIGGMFVGPLYTYLSTFFYWLFRGDPMGIFLFTLIFSSFQASLTYYLFTNLKGRKVGLLSGFLVLICAGLWNKAFAPSAINFLYPMGLIFFYTLSRLKGGKKYFLWMGFILAVTLQIHFSLFFFFPIVVAFLFWQRLFIKKNVRYMLLAILTVFISFLPLIIFDLRHHFFIANNLWRFASHNVVLQSGNSIFTTIFNLLQSLTVFFSYILTPQPGIWISTLLAAVLIFFLLKVKKDFVYKIVSLIFALSLFLYFLYRGAIPDYYFYFLLPPFFLVVSEFLVSFSKNKLFKLPVFLFLIILAFQNLKFINSTMNHYNFRLKKDAALYIKAQSQGKKVKISYDTDLGLGFGFDYLLKFRGVNIENSDFEENYHIVIRKYKDYKGEEFREPGSPVSIKVVKIAKSV